jgi:zinc protease
MSLRLAGLTACFFLVACGGSDKVTDADRGEAGPEAAATSRAFDMPYLMEELDNGLRVIIVKTDYPDIVTLQIPVQTGSRNEVEAGKSGFAHFFEHMMFRGTEAYPADLYNSIVKKAGANFNAFTTDDFTNYHTTFTKPDLEKIIEIEADRFRNLSYSESDFRTEALAVNGEYLKNYSNPIMKAFERTRALAFNTHPYSHTTMGFIEDIEAMPDQIDYSKEFFDRWYRPEYTSVIVVGDVDPESTFGLVEKYWGGWERGTYVADIPVEPEPTGPVYEHIQWDGETQPWLFIGFRSPAFRPHEKDFPAMSVLSSIYFSDSSDLYQKLVIEDQTVDQLLTDFPLNKDPNLNLIYIRLTDEAYAADAEEAVLNTLARARNELIDAARLEQIKSRLRYSFTANLDNSDDIGSMLAQYVQYDRTPETVNEMYAAFEALTAEEVREFANEYFTDISRVTVSLSNSASVSGVGETLSLDELTATLDAAQKAGSPIPAAGEADKEEEVFSSSGDTVPVSIVARQSDSSPLVDVSILVHAGAGMDPPGKKGLASLTANMLSDGGSATWSIQEINAAMYPIASGFSSQVDKEMTRLSGQVHKDNIDTWYRYVRSQLLNPGWREQDFERVRTQLSNAVRTSLVGNNDEELGKEVLYSDIYGRDHPYGSLNLGHSSDILGLTLDDVKGFYRQYYTVNNMTVGVSGGYPDSFIARLSDDLQSLPAGTRARLAVPEMPDVAGSRATIVEKETPAVAISFGFPIDLKRGDPDWLALWLARSWLGEHRTGGRLYDRIRETRGMNYGDYSYIEYFPNGMYRMQPDTNLGRQRQIFQVWIRPVRNNNDAHFATRAAVYELEKLLNDGLSETDFEATRTFLSKYVSLMMDGQSRQLGYAMDSQYYEIDEFSDYVRRGLSALTLADVNRVIRENLRTDNMQYVFVTRDADDLRQRLVSDQTSPISYDAEKPIELLEEDQIIDSIPLGIEADNVRVISAENVFN